MSVPGGDAIGLIRPGEGVPVEQEWLAPIRDELRSGTYVFDDYARQCVRDALADPATPEDAALDILAMSPSKTFRNAFISIAVEQVWPSYSTLATGEDASLYDIRFNGSKARLERQSAKATAGLPLHSIADRIASSNQDMATYFICELFSDGKVPEICGDTAIDRTYFDAFREQAELQFTRTDRFFKTIPLEVNSPSRFIASGLQVLRTHVFGIPNLIDGVAANERAQLTSDQHRVGVEATLAKSITPYFLPTGPLIIAINKQIADRETGRLMPDRWTSNGDPDKYIVFPKPDIVRSANEAAAQRDDLPVQTGCPVFHSRVEPMEAPGAAVPLPRSLAQIVLRQLDVLYYPQRRRELGR